MNDPALQTIARRLNDIEGSMKDLRLDIAATDAARGAATVRPPVARAEAASASAPKFEPKPASAPEPVRGTSRAALVPVPIAVFERLISGRGMAVAGLLLILCGCAYFLELSFTRNWIGPSERIALGLFAGAALLAVSPRFLRGTYRMLAEGTVALGAGLIYLSSWAAVVVFPDLAVPHLAAFATMGAATCALALIANRFRSQPIAVMGLAGAYLTPLFGDYTFDPTALAAYLLIVTLGMLALARCRSFVVVENMTIGAMLLYSFEFAPNPYAHWTDIASATVASLFFVVFAAAFTTRPIRDGNATPLHVVPFIVSCAAYIASLEYIFHTQQTLLGATLGGLAILLLAVPAYTKFPNRMRAAYRALGVLAINLALHALLHKTELFDAMSIEGTVLVLLGRRTHEINVTRIGSAFLAGAAVGLVYDAVTMAPAQGALTPLALGFIVWLRAAFSARRGIPENLRTACSLIAHVVALAGLTRIGLDATGGAHWNVALSNLAQCTLSLSWALFAATLFARGVTSQNRLLRYEGLALFALTIIKVTTIDLASLDLAYRITAFVGIGIVLFASSAWYMRSLKMQHIGSAA